MKAVAALLFALLLSSCSSISSKKDDNGDLQGMSYFLPMKFVTVSLVVNDTGGRTITIGASEALPDQDARYVARFNVSQIAANKLTVKTNAAGLLSEDSTTSTVSSVSDIFQSLAATTVVLPQLTSEDASETCGKGSGHSWVIDPHTGRPVISNGNWQKCDLTISVTKLPDGLKDAQSRKEKAEEEKAKEEKAKSREAKLHAHSSGFFYRRPQAYLVSVTDATGAGTHHEKVLLLPTPQSRLEFLPVSKSFFATNTGSFTFEDGMPKVYTQALDSELLGLLKLPAEVISAYFTAVGSAFTARKTALANEQAYSQQLRAMEVEQQKLLACMRAVATRDQTLIGQACQ